MKPLTIVFFGRSGSGKGTQAQKLIDYIKENRNTRVIYLETGQRFREFIKSEGYISGLVKETLDQGGLLPAFLPIWIWTDFLVKNLKKNDDLILDGICRRSSEAPVFDSAIRFFERKEVCVILIKTSKQWSRDRLLERRRDDDLSDEDVEKRLEWFDKDVVPALKYFEKKDGYHFLEVNGEKPINEVHNDIINKIDWKFYGPFEK